MNNINKILSNKLKEKANKGIKLQFEITIDENEDRALFDTFTKYISIMNGIQYESIDRNVVGCGQSIKMAKFKGDNLKILINELLNSMNGKELINHIDKAYNEYFVRLEDENYVEAKAKQIEQKATKKDEIKIHPNQSTINDFENKKTLELKEEEPRLNILKKKED